MNCPKCKRKIEDLSKYCNHCGINIRQYKTTSLNSTYNYKTYSRLIKPRTNTHQDQYNYSSKYSQVKENNKNEHLDQYNYSTKYSQVTENKNNEHLDQYNYSNTYSKTSTPTNNDHQDQYNYSTTYSKAKEQISSEEDYVKAFIGNDYDRIKKSSFSIATLLFGGFYLFYRKMWTYGFLWLILAMMTGFSSGLIIIMNFILAINFSKIYIAYAKNQVQNIKNTNQNKSSTEILEECRKKGGISSSVPGITITLVIIIALFATVYSSYKVFSNIETENNTDINHIEDLYYTIPTDFENEYNGEYIKTFSNVDDSSCYIKLGVTYQYNTINEYFINEVNNYYPLTTTINNQDWYYSKKIENLTIKNHYATTYEDTLYYVESSTNYENTSCNEKIQSITESLNFNNQQEEYNDSL